ncbi:hydroxycarboxylic acid receptor 3-like [Aulostomus maculatus]
MECSFNGTLLMSVMPPLLITEFILGVISNGLALWIFCFHLKPWKSSTVFLFNLAIADFFLNMALPFRASYYKSDLKWMFGDALCKICLFMLTLNRSGSTFFLMAIAVDRYMRVVHPYHFINSLSIFKAMGAAALLWLITTLMSVHVFFLKHNTTYCESFMVLTDFNSGLSWHKFNFLFTFSMPLCVILFCTVRIIYELRNRQLAQHAKIKKALCFITTVVVLFIICFLPSNIASLLIWYKTNKAIRNLPKAEVCPALEHLIVTFYITVSLTYLNSVLDPVIYYFSSPNFKNIFRKVLRLRQAESSTQT